MIKAIPLVDFVPVYSYDEAPEKDNDAISKESSMQQGELQFISLTHPQSKRIQDEEMQDLFMYKNLSDENSLSVSVGVQMPKKQLILVEGRFIYPRNRDIAQYALTVAQHKCEIDSTHPTFIGKSRNLPYTEPHHLIPLAFSDNFDVSLDVVENIVSLCSNCHNQIHYGMDVELMLKELYESRKVQLERVGINISFEKLLWMYNVVTSEV